MQTSGAVENGVQGGQNEWGRGRQGSVEEQLKDCGHCDEEGDMVGVEEV